MTVLDDAIAAAGQAIEAKMQQVAAEAVSSRPTADMVQGAIDETVAEALTKLAEALNPPPASGD